MLLLATRQAKLFQAADFSDGLLDLHVFLAMSSTWERSVMRIPSEA